MTDVSAPRAAATTLSRIPPSTGRGGIGSAQPPLTGMIRCLDCRSTGRPYFGQG